MMSFVVATRDVNNHPTTGINVIHIVVHTLICVKVLTSERRVNHGRVFHNE